MKRRDFVTLGSRIGLSAIFLPTLLDRGTAAETTSPLFPAFGLPDTGGSRLVGKPQFKCRIVSGAVEFKHSKRAGDVPAGEIADNTRIKFKAGGVIRVNGVEITGKAGESYRLFVRRDESGTAKDARVVRGIPRQEFMEYQRAKQAAKEGK